MKVPAIVRQNAETLTYVGGGVAIAAIGYWAYQHQFGWRTPFPKKYRYPKDKAIRGFAASTRSGSGHGAVDIGLPTGTPIYAAKRGTVSSTTSDCGDPPGMDGHRCLCGHGVIIEHPGGWRSIYCHLDQPPLVRAGDRVRKGQKIGVSGNTGNSYSPHLHISLSKNESRVDPEKYIRFRKVNLASIAAWSVAAVAMSGLLIGGGHYVFGDRA